LSYTLTTYSLWYRAERT